MYGSSTGALRVYLTDPVLENKNIAWELNKQQSNDGYDWKQGIIPLKNINYDYKLLIEATVGKDDSTESTMFGDIA